jgi:ribosomal protein S18 acetylase RimI-like enzyme
MEIREVTEQDAAEYRDLRLMMLVEAPQAFVTDAETFGRQSLADVTQQVRLNHANNNFLFLGAHVEGRLVGVQGLIRHAKTKVRHRADIVGVFVHPDFRGRGVAGALLDAIIEHAQLMQGVEQIVLGVTTTQKSAISLYQSRGFESFGVEPRMIRIGNNYYDIMHMIKFL